MGNAQFKDGTTAHHCDTPQCGIPTVKRQPHNLLASPQSMEESEQQEEAKRNDSLSPTPPPSRTRYVLTTIKTTIKTTIRDIFDPPEPERLPPKRHAPKQLLYGCNSSDEHYDYIDEMCEMVANLHGKEGLEVMGFDFRLVHRDKTCTCAGVPMHMRNSRAATADDDKDELTDSEVDPEEMKEGYLESSEEGDDYGQFDYDGSEEDDGGGETKSESFMVPIGSPLKLQEQRQPLETITSQRALPDNSSNNNTKNNFNSYQTPVGASSSSYASSSAFTRKDSALSLFSLATHNTDFSNPTANTSRTGGDDSSRQRRNPTTGSTTRQPKSARFPLASISSAPNFAVMEQDSCALRLHHTATGTMITPENHTKYMADGKFYDELARLCMEYSQQLMMEEANLERVTVSDDPHYGAIATKSYLEKRKRQRQQGSNNNKRNKTLLVVTGKGQVQAGIFSRRHLLVTSMEAATALPFIRGAMERDMDIVMLDPNALGYRNGMDVVERSLEHVFLSDGHELLDENEEVYILAHSMAGAQIVRFFIDNSSCHHSRPATPSSCASSISEKTTSSNGSSSNHSAASSPTTSNNANTDGNATTTVDKTALRLQLLQRVKAFALTDSNHNINWIKNHPQLMQALTGPPSLYIKSHKVHEKAKELGQAHHDCQFWRHRFGDIKTLWAGTHEHALTNYTARAHIWEHFDQFLKDPAAPAAQQRLPPKSSTVPAKS